MFEHFLIFCDILVLGDPPSYLTAMFYKKPPSPIRRFSFLGPRISFLNYQKKKIVKHRFITLKKLCVFEKAS